MDCCRDGQQSQFPELSAYSFTNNFYIVSCGHKQNKRGGRVKLQSIVMPVMEFDHPEKGDALYCMLTLLLYPQLVGTTAVLLSWSLQLSSLIRMVSYTALSLCPYASPFFCSVLFIVIPNVQP
jgi:hypothetical protein